MSKERCNAVKALMKQSIGILQGGTAGTGRGINLAITYLEDAYLRLDFHMREQGWVGESVPLPPSNPDVIPPIPAKSVSPGPGIASYNVPNSKPLPGPTIPPNFIADKLKPAGSRLSTGLMNNPKPQTDTQS